MTIGDWVIRQTHGVRRYSEGSTAYLQAVYSGLLSSKLLRWGGTLKVLPPSAKHRDSQWHRSRGWFAAPFTTQNLGIHWDRKILYVGRDWFDESNYPYSIAGIIHEMGHLFASNKPPDECDEFDFLGWEWVVACEVGMPPEDFRRGNSDYGVDDRNVSDLESWEWTDLLIERVNAAAENGLIKEGQARSIR